MRKKYLFRELLVIPLVFLQSFLTVVGDKVPLPAEDMLLFSIAGRVSEELVQAVILATDQMVFLLLFLLLFGDFLAEQLRTGAVYQFSRMLSRRFWYYHQIGSFTGYSFGYAFLYVGLHAIVTVIASEPGPGNGFFMIFVKLFCIVGLLLLLFGLLCNWLCSMTGVAPGVVICMGLTAICAVLAAQPGIVSWIQMLNPAYYPIELFSERREALGKAGVLCIETAIVSVAAGLYFCRKDIYPADGEG